MDEHQFKDRVSLLLSGLDEGREVRTYLQQFSRADGGCFAVVKIGGALIAEEAQALGQRLALLQALGLKPVVVCGSGPQLDHRLAEAGITNERVNGLRVTRPEAMGIVAQEAAMTALSLVDAVASAGGRATLAPPATVRGQVLDEAVYGRVGDAVGVHEDGLRALLATDAIPLISCVAQGDDGVLLNVNADAVAREVARAFRPLKIVFLTQTGGLLDKDGAIINSINLVTDFEPMMEEGWVAGGMAVKIRQINTLLTDLPISSSVSMTNTDQLMRELFTYGGAGTLIRRGERVLETQTADIAQLTPLLEASFQAPLREGYWDDLPLSCVIQTERCRAAAIVTEVDGILCLDKFAVTPDARGEGLAKAVWRELKAKSSTLIWRSQHSNPFNTFYLSESDGSVRHGKWRVFWYGDAMGASALDRAAQLASAPADFVGR